MKLLVVNPPNEPYSERSLLIEPIDVLGIATYAKSIGHDVRVLDMDVKQLPPESIEDILSSFQPQITVIPFDYHIPLHTSDSISNVNIIGKIAKDHGSKVVVGGKTSRYNPSAFLNCGADVIINGEMELALSDLSGLKKWSLENLAKIRGISYNHEGTINTTESRSEKINLDSLKMIDRSFVDVSDYIEVRTMLSSRGCFGKCSFCPTTDYWGSWRGRSPENVTDEIEHLVQKYSAKKILFIDDNATVSKERMKKISRNIIDRGIETRLGCLGTVQAYDRSTTELMQKAGFRWIHYGIESGNYDVLFANGKNITSEQIRKAIVETKDSGLRVRTSWIFDLPGTNEKALSDTIDLILDTEPQEIRAHFLALRAGTELYSRVFRGQTFPSQYIHKDQPLIDLSGYNREKIVSAIEALTKELQTRGYLVIRDVKSWREVDKLREQDHSLRFISFCPSRYGLNWERT